MEIYRYSKFAENRIPERFVQDNFSSSKRHVLRGLYHQKTPQAQGKLVGDRFRSLLRYRGGHSARLTDPLVGVSVALSNMRHNVDRVGDFGLPTAVGV
jgi:hypothetical protein